VANGAEEGLFIRVGQHGAHGTFFDPAAPVVDSAQAVGVPRHLGIGPVSAIVTMGTAELVVLDIETTEVTLA